MKVTKSDDVEVPEHIWYGHMFEDSTRRWTEAKREALLQAGMLRFYKRRVTISFLTWLRQEHTALLALDWEYASCVERREGRSNFVETNEGATTKFWNKTGLAGYRNTPESHE
jgi:hypothetical protein